MKKTHLVMLIIAAVTALFSAYSLAAINQVYKINFDWYSQFNNTYCSEPRDVSRDKWQLDGYPDDMKFYFLGKDYELDFTGSEREAENIGINDADLKKYTYIYCKLGKVDSPEYRMKIIDIAQRGSVVEIKVSMNSPARQGSNMVGAGYTYMPDDTVRINRAAFPTKGRLNFIFKNQDGNKLYETEYEVK